jgi:glycosyltransferase involved in cell wall biosynthesis
MRRVLLITFVYPPTEIIGAVRPAALAKYLPRFGWEAIILTPKVEPGRSDSRIIETGYRSALASWKARLGLDGQRSLHEQFRLPVSSRAGSGLFHTRAIDLAKYFMVYPDETKGWLPFAMQAIDGIRQQGPQIDAILTTSPPISAHLIGRRAKAALGCPWVADLRDLWTQNLANPHPRLDSLQIGLEKRTLGDADALVTVSEPWAARLRYRHPSKPVCAITNGFDPEHFAPLSKELTAKFTITYAGILYQGRRDPSVLFEVLRELCDQKIVRPEDVRVRFYGPIEPWVTAQVQQHRLEEVVEFHGVVSRSEAMQRQAESQVLLMLGWTDPRETGQHSGKLFEYLGAARPILAVGGSASVLTDTLNETGAGPHAFSKAEIRDFLIAAYSEFKTRGYVAYRGQEAAVAGYTHLQMARRFAEVLDQAGEGAVAAAENVAVANYAR